MATSTTNAVNSPVRANSSAIQRSKSVSSASEVDNGGLRHHVLEESPEGHRVRLGVPRLELAQCLRDVRRLLIGTIGSRLRKDRRGDRDEAREDRAPGGTVGRPAEA